MSAPVPETMDMSEFRLYVKTWVQSRDTNRNDLAREFEVGLSTVDRWWIGSATPHPRLQAQVVAWIKARLPGSS